MRCFVDGGANVKQQIKSFLTGGVFALALLSVAVAGSREDGWTAYGRGDYATAMAYWRPLADQGNVLAQLILGQMYLKGGGGVPQDYAQALVWYRKAADQGNAAAQGMLGRMYANGHGVPQDNVLAHLWFNLAASRAVGTATHDRAADSRDEVAAKMTPEQIAEAQRLAREWKPTKQ
jgi:TPR repeat protein